MRNCESATEPNNIRRKSLVVYLFFSAGLFVDRGDGGAHGILQRGLSDFREIDLRPPLPAPGAVYGTDYRRIEGTKGGLIDRGQFDDSDFLLSVEHRKDFAVDAERRLVEMRQLDRTGHGECNGAECIDGHHCYCFFFPVTKYIPDSTISPPAIISGVIDSFRNNAPQMNPKTGIRNVTVVALVGPSILRSR